MRRLVAPLLVALLVLTVLSGCREQERLYVDLDPTTTSTARLPGADATLP